MMKFLFKNIHIPYSLTTQISTEKFNVYIIIYYAEKIVCNIESRNKTSNLNLIAMERYSREMW